MEIRQNSLKQSMDQQIKREIRKYLRDQWKQKYNISKFIRYRDTKEKFVAINASIKKQERSQINNLALQFKKLEKE